VKLARFRNHLRLRSPACCIHRTAHARGRRLARPRRAYVTAKQRPQARKECWGEISGVRQSYVGGYTISYQSQAGSPLPWQTPWYGWNQWSDNSYNRAEFNDWFTFHHKQIADTYTDTATEPVTLPLRFTAPWDLTRSTP